MCVMEKSEGRLMGWVAGVEGVGVLQVSGAGPGRSGKGMNLGLGEIHGTGREGESSRLGRGGLCSVLREGRDSAVGAIPACTPPTEPAQELSSTRCS